MGLLYFLKHFLILDWRRFLYYPTWQEILMRYLISLAFMVLMGCGQGRNPDPSLKAKEVEQSPTNMILLEQTGIGRSASQGSLQVICDSKRKNLVYILQGEYNNTNYVSTPASIAIQYREEGCDPKSIPQAEAK
jgi:hypothetical protein